MRSNTIRTLSVTGIVVSLLIAAGPIWAHDHDRHYGYGPRYMHSYRPAVVVVPQAAYGYPTAPVYYAPPPVYAPAPVYYGPPAYVPAPVYYGPPPMRYAPLGAIGGAVTGAVIGGGMARGDNRVAAIAIGSVLGAVVGDSLSRGR